MRSPPYVSDTLILTNLKAMAHNPQFKGHNLVFIPICSHRNGITLEIRLV